MEITHALLAPDGLWWWAEADPAEDPPEPPNHPFAARSVRLSSDPATVPMACSDGRRRIGLPTAAGKPLASWGAVAAGQDAGQDPDRHPTIAAWEVPVRATGWRETLRLLGTLPADDPVIGQDARFLAEVELLALELAARGRFVPSPADPGGWAMVPAVGDQDRLRILAHAMPASCLAGLDAADAAGDRLAAMTAWMNGLLGTIVQAAMARRKRPLSSPAWLADRVTGTSSLDGAPAPISADLATVLDRWREVVRPLGGPFRTTVRLAEPEPLPGAAWHLEILLASRDDPSLVATAAQVVADPGPLAGVGGADPEVALLADLGRASRLYPPLAGALQGPVPADLDLDDAGAHAFLRDGATVLAEAGFGVLLPAWWRSTRRRLALRLHVRPRKRSARSATGAGLGSQALVDYDWRVAVGDAEISAGELEALAAAKAGLVRVRGAWVEVEPGELAAILRTVGTGRGPAARRPMTVGEAVRLALGLDAAPGRLEVAGVVAEGWLAPLLSGTLGGAPPEPMATPPSFTGELRPYQQRGLGWLAGLDRLGFGGCLADDMGLGKTAQLLALLAVEAATVPPPERGGPTLVVCPMSLVGNWQREAARFVPTLSVHVHHGTDRASEPEALAAAVQGVEIVLTTYGLVARDRAALAAVAWRRIVLDEAQEIKNVETDQSRAVRSLRAPSRFALTGTPIENRLSELWAVMDFANPGIFGTEASFREHFATPIERFSDERAEARLRRLTGPFILRRSKSDPAIVPELPPKLELPTPCNLTREQASLYQAVVDELLPDLERADDAASYRGQVLRAILRLKQICDHPALFLGDGSPLQGRSGKLERLEEIVDQVLASDERALVFTQFTEWGERLVPYLRTRFGREVLYLHGGLSRSARDSVVERFQSGAAPLFVLSLKAGGKGLNLVAANHVVHFDRWWNPAVEDQASDRAYRIGQQRQVFVRTLIAVGTVEDRIAAMLAAKRELAARIIRSGETPFTELSLADLAAVLRLSPDAVGAE